MEEFLQPAAGNHGWKLLVQMVETGFQVGEPPS
jgi:hypothetical protein